jgi:rfaE bifunctional protein nucleotidyltransferase chain/domain
MNIIFDDVETLYKQVQYWKDTGDTVVFTNGCFDLLHYGHIQYLQAAAQLGDRLVIAVNSSASVSRLKGSHRPINDEATRVHLLAALRMVHAVIVFHDDTPLSLIERLIPDVLVKGGDWQPNQIVGADIVLAAGGQVRALPFAEGYSTTRIEQKIKQQPLVP